jgi:hypothetical protein
MLEKKAHNAMCAHQFPLIYVDELTDEQRQALERTIKAVGGVNVPLHGTDGRTMSKGDYPAKYLLIYLLRGYSLIICNCLMPDSYACELRRSWKAKAWW